MCCVEAFAQTPAEVEQANQEARRLQQLEIQRQQEQFLRDRSSASPPTKLTVPEVTAPAKEKGACRDVTAIHIGGVTLLPSAVVDEIVGRYLNRCLGVSDIESLLADITRAYIEKGWISVRAYLPQQDLSKGHLEILVVEGKVSKIEVDDGGKQSISLGNVAPSVEGKPLNIRDLEQALDQINRLASNSATVDMLPGAESGDTVVVLHNQPGTPLHASLSLDNQGSESTGNTQAGVTLALDNPLHLNDFVSYTRRQSIPATEGIKLSVSDSLSYVVPFGYTTLSVNLNKSRYASTLTTAAGTVLHNSGDSSNSAVRLDRVLYRDAFTRWNAYGNLTSKDSNSFLENVLLASASRQLTVLDAGVSMSTVFLGGAITLDLGASQGLTYFNALRDAADLTPSDPRAQFRKWNFSGNYSRPFSLVGQELQFSSQWAGQYAENVLYGSEQMLIGGIYTVRGFTNSTLSGDHGFYIRNEIGLRRPFSSGDLSGSVRPWIGLDYGDSRSRNRGVPEGTLTGYALGVQVNLKNGLSFDVFSSAPLSKPDSLKRESAQTWLRLSMAL